jgi:5-methyltetrahydrofolate--homocysteine methyltransferase
MDAEGIPKTAERRLSIAHKIVERAEKIGIPREDIVLDCLNMPIGADNTCALAVIESIRRVKAELGVNMTLGGSNISFGLPDRNLINAAFLTLAIEAGVTCPVVNAAQVRPSILAIDAVLGRDNYMMRYIKAYRQRNK